jgi:hypothetical protein
MGACHSNEATAKTNTAAIEPMKLPSALSPIPDNNPLKSNEGVSPSPVPSPPSPTVTTNANSPESQVERLEIRKTSPITQNEEKENNDLTRVASHSAPPQVVVEPIKQTETSVVDTPESLDEISRRRSGSHSQTPGRRSNRRDRDSISQSRPVTRRSTSGVSRAAQLFADWSATAPAPELPTIDRGPRTMIISAQQPFRSSDAPLPEPQNDNSTGTNSSSSMQVVVEEEKH